MVGSGATLPTVTKTNKERRLYAMTKRELIYDLALQCAVVKVKSANVKDTMLKNVLIDEMRSALASLSQDLSVDDLLAQINSIKD